MPLKRLLILLALILFLPVGIFLVREATTFLGRAFGTPANLVIDAASKFDVPLDVWKNLGQGGEEKARMLAPVVAKVRTLSPKYIRLDHIFDAYDVVSRDGSGGLAFNWTKLDETLADVKAIGAIPFISISYMPPAISKSDIVDVPNTWSEWELVTQRLIEHISGERGLNLAGVYYEIWNEPDLFGGFKVYGPKNYLDLYYHSAVGASRARRTNYYELGGPATTALYKNWFDGFLKFVAKNNLRLNFFSWHRYSKSLATYEEDINSVKSWLANYPDFASLELIISELGPNSENDPVYDGNFGAIHTIATSALLEGLIDKSILFEIKDGPGEKQYWGRWGILTHEKFGDPLAKPRFSALTFLNRMVGTNLAVTGQGSWVKAFAKEKDGILRTLVVNYDPNGSHFEAVPMTFNNLTSGNFTFRRVAFGGKTDEQTVATTSATWATTVSMEPNTAAIFEIVPQ